MQYILLGVIAMLFCLPASSQTGDWKEDVHYVVLESSPAEHNSERVEVVEFFGYKCPACNAVEPHLAAWKKQNPEDIEFAVVPMAWSPAWREYARLYFVLRALGREDDLHQAVFDTVHRQKQPLATKDPKESFQLQLAFAQAHGIGEQQFTEVHRSPARDADIELAIQTAQRLKVDSTPTVVVAGKYLTNFKMAGNERNLIEIAKYLAATERGRSTRVSKN